MKENKELKALAGEMLLLNNLIQTLGGVALGLLVTPICLIFWGYPKETVPVINAMVTADIIIYIMCCVWIFISKKKIEMLQKDEENNKKKSWVRTPPQYSVNVETASVEFGYMYNYEQMANWADEALSEAHWKYIQHQLFMLRQKEVEIIEEDPYIKIIVKRI